MNEYIEEHIKRHGRRQVLHAKRHAEKVQLKKTLKAHDERNVKQKDSSSAPDGALPTYLLDPLSTAIKEKRKDKAAKYAVPLPKVRGIAEDEMFKVMRTGKSKKKAWKRMVTKATFVGRDGRFIRPMALRYKKANVTHRVSWIRFLLNWLHTGVKKNPQSPMYTQLGVLTKGTVVEVNYAQITNNPENDGCINAVL
ncbi:ribosomal protein S8e/ribosomal biogenesis NSA2, partial [Fomitopsis serialis]|uniref:ribosomal protein S8e/ribosomal biogenesis NSA2 n=1 Tax=Fomitopsis serialis TaxID=139415 RepID=UPI002008BFEB